MKREKGRDTGSYVYSHSTYIKGKLQIEMELMKYYKNSSVFVRYY